MLPVLLPSIESHDPVLRPNAQGITRVSVTDATAQQPAPTLLVTFGRPIRLPDQNYLLEPRSYTLTGGQRLFPHIQKVEQAAPSQVVLHLDRDGDFSIYTLSVSGPEIDPLFASRKLRFRLACDDPFDNRAAAGPLSPEPEPPVAIDYLAKDYASFRQALLDFVATRMPAWVERSEADIGMMLLELFAATADQLSYLQDRVANEAFLSSATQRRSVAGHLALIDYLMDEGAAAYTWLQFQVNAMVTLTAAPGFQVSNSVRRADEPLIIFESLSTATLQPAHNQMAIYDWGNADACLPHAGVSAALVGSFEQLAAGDYLLFDDGRGQRDVIRLSTRPQIIPADPVRGRPDGPLTLIQWLPSLPLSGDYCIRNTLVRGNMVVATHGETVPSDVLRALTAQEQAAVRAAITTRSPAHRVPRQRLRLTHAPLAFIDASTLALVTPIDQPAMATGDSQPFVAVAARSVSTLTLEVEGFTKPWQPRVTLLDSRPDEQVFRVEIDDQGDATVVFGDNNFGRQPEETARITATYRVGGGTAGNVAADTLNLARPRADEQIGWLISVTNPLPARGGRDLETSDHARRFGPAAFKQPLVAVTAGDYQAAAQSFLDRQGQPLLQRATAAFRWTGSWLTATLAVDPVGAERLAADLRNDLLALLDQRRLAGYDLDVVRALYVPVDLEITFCTAPGFRTSDVEQQLQQVLGSTDQPGGQRGFFHPDNFSFGDNLYVSKLFVAIVAVPGVQSVQITRFAKLHAGRPEIETTANLRRGFLPVGADQIIRLDNDRNFPENGTLTIRTQGRNV